MATVKEAHEVVTQPVANAAAGLAAETMTEVTVKVGDSGGRAGAVIVYQRSTACSDGAMRFGRAWSVHAPEEMS